MDKIASTIFLGCTALALSPVTAQNAKKPDVKNESSKPNVLFIMTDQQSYNMMSCMDNKWLSTPNMDRLAKEGCRFEKAYCVNPVSMPSRFSLLTGRYSTEVGIKINNGKYNKENLARIVSESSVGTLFKNAGYNTQYAGKSHLYGFNELNSYGFNFNGANPYDGPAIFAEKFLSEKSDDKPFFLFLSFMNPHDICQDAGYTPRFDKLKAATTATTRKYIRLQKEMDPQLYKSQIPPIPANAAPDWASTPLSNNGSGQREWTTEQWDFYRWMYCRLTESVDEQIGRVLVALDKSGKAQNTIIVFTSDHGDMDQSHAIAHKSQLLEECQKIPFIFVGKGIMSNVADKETLTCNGLDFAPTICDLVGIKPAASLPGASLRGVLTGSNPDLSREHIIIESGSGYQINDGRYKYSVYEKGNVRESLTDLVKDPGETKNLIADPAYKTIKAKLGTLLMANLKQRQLLPLKEFISSKESDE